MAEMIPVSTQTHANKGWQPAKDYAFARSRTLVPLTFDELTTAAGHFVLGFIKPQKRYQLVALLGPGFNAYVHGGRWLGAYVPAKLRSAPFDLGFAADQPERPLLCIDPDAVVETPEAPDHHPLFTAEGQLAERTAKVLDFLHRCLQGQLALEQIGDDLADLIEPWPLQLPTPGGEHALADLYRINEQALKALDPQQLARLNQRQGLGVAYAQLISTGHLHELRQRAQVISQRQSTEGLDFDNLFGSDNERLRFDFDDDTRL